MLLKVTTGKTSSTHNFDSSSSYIEFINSISTLTSIPRYELDILIGYPPKPLFLSSHSVHDSLLQLGVENGCVILVRRNADRGELYKQLISMGFKEHTAVVALHQNTSKLSIEQLISHCQVLEDARKDTDTIFSREVRRKVIPSDNSCLFHAVDFCLTGNPPLSKESFKLRKTVADVIRSNEVLYNKDFLDKDPSEYIRWIQEPNSWGGEIELSILSSCLKVEITVVDIRTTMALTYGENESFLKRIFLLYDGIHYDAIIEVTIYESGTMQTSKELACFPTTNRESIVRMLDMSKALASELNKKKQFTNLVSDSYICNECFEVMIGEKGARNHAQQSGHTNFGQVV